MTTIALTPLELYSVVVVAVMVCFFGVLGVKELHRLESAKERLVALGGLLAVFGLPVAVFVRALL